MPRLFSKSNYSFDDVVTNENAVICGVVIGACALAVFSLTAFFLAVAVSLGIILFNEIQKNNDSLETRLFNLF